MSSFCKGSHKQIISVDSTTNIPKECEEDLKLGARLVDVLQELIKLWLDDQDILSTISGVIKDCCKCEIPIFTSQLPRILQLVSAVFCEKQLACLIAVATGVLVNISASSLMSFNDDLCVSCTSLATVFASKCSSWEMMTEQPDIAFEFFEFLAIVSI